MPEPSSALVLRKCPNCHRKVDARELVCPFCGFVFKASGTTLALKKEDDDDDPDPRWGTARFNQRMKLVLTLKNKNSVHFTFDPAQIELIVMGRRDPVSGDHPTVDLQDHDAEEQGVSRRHAVIKRMSSNALQLIDNASVNGTFLNGQIMLPHEPRILRDGDEVRLGRLVIDVSFTVVE